MTQTLGYFAPRPDGRRRGPSSWLVAGAIVAVTGFCFFRLATPYIEGSTEDARKSAAQTDVVNLSTAVDAFARDTGRYPKAAEGFPALVSPPGGLPGWNGPYVDRLINDPWGHPFVYRLGGPRGGAGYRVLSMGPDGWQGSSDDIIAGSNAATVRKALPAPSSPATRPW